MSRPSPLPVRPARLVLLALASLTCAPLTGCIEGTDGPHITAARPAPAMPGERLRVEGIGFGDGGHVAIGGRPLGGAVWGAEAIEVTLPADLPSGPSWLVVVSGGRPSPEFPIEVGGDNPRPPDGPRVFPPGAFPDGGRTDGGPPRPDRGPDPDDGVLPDVGPGGPLVATFDPDPAGDGTVRLEALDAPDGRLILAVRVPADAGVRGLALHLAYDRGLLRFAEASPRGGRDFAVAEIGPGRLALGRVLGGGAGEANTVLTFDLVGPGEGRVDVPARHRTARDLANRPIPAVDFAGGGVRVRRR